ncbi:hypothetical protein KFE98_08080 [bacterium SCSIO 12741]|nr:hypothetical protein KFE98_08080 [bacterium SCSIO 12741]
MNAFDLAGRLLIWTSILTLSGGVILAVWKRNFSYLSLYLLLLLMMETTGMIFTVIKGKNLFVFSLSSAIHFAFLTLFYIDALKLNLKRPVAVAIALLPFPFYFLPGLEITSFQPWDRALLSSLLFCYSLVYFAWLIQRRVQINKPVVYLSGAVLLFFTIDAFLSMGTNYLISKVNLTVVAWFWFFRAVFLILYYVFLIYANQALWKKS